MTRNKDDAGRPRFPAWLFRRRARPPAPVKDDATRSQRLWFTAATKDPFGAAARAERERKEEFFRDLFPDLDALDEQDCF